MDDSTKQVLLKILSLLNKLLDKLPTIATLVIGYSLREEIVTIVREIITIL